MPEKNRCFIFHSVICLVNLAGEASIRIPEVKISLELADEKICADGIDQPRIIDNFRFICVSCASRSTRIGGMYRLREELTYAGNRSGTARACARCLFQEMLVQ